jgi:dipeptidase D
MGGHSGLDIHKPRANAIRLMARLVQALAERHHFHFVSMQGGDLRNAIPRNASALFQGPAAGFNDFRNLVRKATARFRADFVEETGLDIQVAPTDERTSHRPTREATRQLMQILMDCPFGVHAWADHLDGVPETSNNLTPVRIADGRIEMGLMLRSLVDSARDALADNIVRFLEDAGLEAHRGGVYPGWQPDPDSPLLKRAVACYRQVNGHDPEIRVIHAGLECGLIGAARPGMEMISFGPVILGAHSPDERLSLPSTEKFWIFLVALLADLARS